jgi:hypothetical protein
MSCERTAKRQNKKKADATQFARDWMLKNYPELRDKVPDQYLIRVGLLVDFVIDYLNSPQS